MSTAAADRENLTNQAEICSKMGRYDDMMKVVKLLVNKTSISKPLTEKERDLLAIAYKNCVGVRRTAWRNVSKVERIEKGGNSNRQRLEIVSAYKKTIENELVAICKELLLLLDKKVIMKTMDDESAVFSYKMKGDYSRYIAEVNVDNQAVAKSHVTAAEAAYKVAHTRAEKGLSDTHPLRLGLALNYSVFLHEMKDDHVTAIQVAKQRYDEALDELGAVSVVDQGRFGECRNLLTLLHENLKIWTNTQ